MSKKGLLYMIFSRFGTAGRNDLSDSAVCPNLITNDRSSLGFYGDLDRLVDVGLTNSQYLYRSSSVLMPRLRSLASEQFRLNKKNRQNLSFPFCMLLDIVYHLSSG